jgi:zinc protease
MNDLETMTWPTPRLVRHLVRAEQRLRGDRTGDVDHKAVFALAEKYYGPLEGRALPVRKPQTEPAQDGTRRVNVKAPAELPVLIMGYKAPVLRDVDKDSEPYALDMLSAILDGHDAARFNKKLVRETRLRCRSASITTPPRAARACFYLHGSPSEGKTVADLEAALRAEIAHVQKEASAKQELKRAKAQLVASQVYKLDSMFGQAMEIGQNESAGIPLPKNRPHAGKAAASERR